MAITPADTVVMDLLSNTFLMGCDSSGMPVRAHKDGGCYHLLGSMEGSPTSALRAALKLATSILTVAKSAWRIILLSPTPHYVTGKCCSNDDHISNFEDPDYRMVLEEAADNAGRAISAWATSN